MKDHPKEVDAFAAQARSFIEWCHGSHAGETAEQMQRQALTQLARVYAVALDLPGVDFVQAPEPPCQTPEARQRLAVSLQQLPFRHYWEVFNPTDEEDHEPVCGDLLDDFLDICGDLADGLWLYERKHYAAAVSWWVQMFGVHWGKHVLSAMHALHSFEPPEG